MKFVKIIGLKEKENRNSNQKVNNHTCNNNKKPYPLLNYTKLKNNPPYSKDNFIPETVTKLYNKQCYSKSLQNTGFKQKPKEDKVLFYQKKEKKNQFNKHKTINKPLVKINLDKMSTEACYSCDNLNTNHTDNAKDYSDNKNNNIEFVSPVFSQPLIKEVKPNPFYITNQEQLIRSIHDSLIISEHSNIGLNNLSLQNIFDQLLSLTNDVLPKKRGPLTEENKLKVNNLDKVLNKSNDISEVIIVFTKSVII